jgi:uncharacterized protein (DUF58 family)
VREFTRDDDWRLTIALDVAPLPENNDAPKYAEQFERAVTFAASLLTHFLDEGAEIRLLIGDYNSGFGRENEHRYALLKQLARVTLPLAALPEAEPSSQPEAPPSTTTATTTSLTARMPALSEDEFKILITPSVRGSIPTHIWRRAHVVYFDDL